MAITLTLMAQLAAHTARRATARLERSWAGPMRAPAAARPVRPARVVRVVRMVEDRGQSAGAGRMVISGRLADVCAELDRMAAMEAAA